MQLLLQHAHDPDGDYHGNYMSLVTHQVNLVQSEPGIRRWDGFRAGHAPGIEQIRMNHNHAHYCAQKQISAENPRRTDGDEHRQEHESGIAEQMQDGISAGLGHGRINLAEAFQKSH